jgi:hypothetical protein
VSYKFTCPRCNKSCIEPSEDEIGDWSKRGHYCSTKCKILYVWGEDNTPEGIFHDHILGNTKLTAQEINCIYDAYIELKLDLAFKDPVCHCDPKDLLSDGHDKNKCAWWKAKNGR